MCTQSIKLYVKYYANINKLQKKMHACVKLDFNASNLQSAPKIRRWAITWFCDFTGDTRLHSFSDCYALLQHSFTRVTVASGGDGNCPEYQVKCYDFEHLAASDIAESSSNYAHSE